MINKELFYKVTLIDCNGKELEVAKFLQILTGMEKTETRRIVASLPCVWGFGLLLSVSGLLSTGEHYKRSAEKQCHSLTVDESRKENARRGA